MARLTKDGISYELTDASQLAAFRAAGWQEAAPAEKPKRAAVRKPQAKAAKQQD